MVDLHTAPTMIGIRIKHSKTDKFGRGISVHESVYVGRTSNDICPVKAILEYLAIRPQTEGALFVTEDMRPLTKQQFVGKVKAALIRTGIDATQYKGHYFQIGAATTAAVRGVPESRIKTMGRWASSTYLLYIKIPRQELANISSVCSRVALG